MEIDKLLQKVVSVILTKLHQPGDATLTPLSQIMKKLTPELFNMQKRHQIRDMKDLSCCKDTDVLLLLTFFTNELCQEIWMQTGNFKSPRIIKVHQIYIQNIMGECLLGFHSITGCDTVSHFRGYGKKKSWKVFEKHSELLRN